MFYILRWRTCNVLHSFFQSNSRFNRAKEELLSSLPATATPEYKEAALSNFYSQWLVQERVRLRNYADVWSRQNGTEILLAARAAIRKFRALLGGGR